jgi:hypothetical protein
MKIKGDIQYEDCGVSEEVFPCKGKCWASKEVLYNTFYLKVCPYCRISTSLPFGPDLKTATIFECGRLGYGRGVTAQRNTSKTNSCS